MKINERFKIKNYITNSVNRTFRYSLWTINMVNDEEQIIVEIEDEEFLDYIGE